jgi:7-alpha-hydroxysteroid dehydrogenase
MTEDHSSTLAKAGSDEFRLDGHVALITGAGRGIGACIARVFASAGADVAVVARTGAELETVATAVRASGRSALVLPADVTDVSRAAELVERTIAEFGRLDVLINNAGGAAPTPYMATTPEAMDEAFHFNVAAPFELTKRATPHLLDSARGCVINITSRMDRLAARGLVTYGTVKAALAHMTRLLAAELAPTIRVNGIAPAIVETDELRRALDDARRRETALATPLQRLASVADVANAARWLASPAASYITGKIIEIDGGAEFPTLPDDTPDLQTSSR